MLPNRLLEGWLISEYLSASNEIDRKIYHELTQENLKKLIKPIHKGIRVLMGVFYVQTAQDRLANLVNDTSFRDSNYAKTYMAELLVDLEGRLSEESITCSSLPWAVSQLEDKLLLGQWHTQFNQFSHEIIERLVEQFRLNESPDLLTKLTWLNQWLIAQFQWQNYCRAELYFMPVSRDADESSGLLNSFFVGDISLLLREKAGLSSSTALGRYLSRQPSQPLVDIRQQSDVLRQLTKAAMLPDGAWPSPHSLSLMQQVAVNQVVNQLAGTTGLFSVNGPPGTGKTTLLKDVFANIIVARAKKLMAYDQPADAFTRMNDTMALSATFKTDWFRFDTDLTDDAIIVASSNNTAVENISKEIPSSDGKFLDEYTANKYPVDVYFRTIAQYLTEDTTAWNALAVPLGKAENRAKFITKWFGNKEKKENGIRQLLSQTAYSTTDWQRAKADLTQALVKLAEWRQKAGEAEIVLNDPLLIEALAPYQYDVARAQQALARESHMLKAGFVTNDQATTALTNQFRILKEQKPPFWHFWFRLKRAKAYQMEVTALYDQLKQLSDERKHLTNQLAYVERQVEQLDKLAAIRTVFGATTPDPAYWYSVNHENPSLAQELAPFITKEVRQAQFTVFLAALHVQQVFVGLAKQPLMANMSILLAHFNRSVHLRSEVLREVWNTLFLFIPIISTTFASVGRLLQGVGRETFGWLFVDEAGQAVPQAAVGALWRCKRAVLIGDPIQIEPVVTLPGKVFDHLRMQQQLSADYFNPYESVQTFGDASNSLGTHLASGVWVGSPLRVHRRCLEPMFSIANQIAYDGLMQNANRDRQPSDWGIGRSRFVHVTGNCTNKQWVPEQGQVALNLIRAYHQMVSQQPDKPFSLFVITPFRTVANEFKALVKQNAHDVWPKILHNIGTVHTFQGKEADVVVFIIGCDESRRAALTWADSKPNLLNVALTRAKQQFIAIGNRDLVQHTNYFATMVRALDAFNTSFG